MLLRLSDIYLRNPGTVEMHTLRGQVERVIPPRVREYSDEDGSSVVLTVILKDMPGVIQHQQRQENLVMSQNQNQQQQKLKLSSSDYDDDDKEKEDEDFSVEKQKVISNDPIVMGGVTKATAKSSDNPAIPEQEAISTRRKMQNQLRVFFYDEWAKALSFCSPGDVLELRTSWHVFLNPETQIKSNIVGKLSTTHENSGSNAAEHLVTTTARSDVSVYSKSDQDIIELCFNEKTLSASEPVARVAKGIKF